LRYFPLPPVAHTRSGAGERGAGEYEIVGIDQDMPDFAVRTHTFDAEGIILGNADAAGRGDPEHGFAAERIHADDTTVPVLAKGKTRTGRLWVYVRDDRPFGGRDPPSAAFFYSPDRGGEHPERHLANYAGLMQADAYAGFNQLYETARKPGPIIEATCWAHARRKFFDLARLKKAPIAIEAVARIDALFAIEREINGMTPDQRLRVRNERSRPLIADLEIWLTGRAFRSGSALRTGEPGAKARARADNPDQSRPRVPVSANDKIPGHAATVPMELERTRLHYRKLD